MNQSDQSPIRLACSLEEDVRYGIIFGRIWSIHLTDLYRRHFPETEQIARAAIKKPRVFAFFSASARKFVYRGWVWQHRTERIFDQHYSPRVYEEKIRSVRVLRDEMNGWQVTCSPPA
jgi:hypothetical protein